MLSCYRSGVRLRKDIHIGVKVKTIITMILSAGAMLVQTDITDNQNVAQQPVLSAQIQTSTGQNSPNVIAPKR
jgi:hypothetical protein